MDKTKENLMRIKAKARCLMKKVYGQEYATRDPAE